MQNKEIEKTIKVVTNDVCSKCYFPKKRTCKSCIKQSRKLLKEYIEQLETKVKEVIDKSKKDIKKNNEFEFLPLQVEKAYNNYYKIGKIEEAQEILEILKEK